VNKTVTDFEGIYTDTPTRRYAPANQHIAGHFGDESFQSITCTGTDNLTRTTKTQNTQMSQNNNAKRVPSEHSNDLRLRDRTDRA